MYLLLPEFFFSVRENKSEKMRANIQIMYFNVFFPFASPGHVYIRSAAAFAAWRERYMECLALSSFAPVIHNFHYKGQCFIFLASHRGDDTHTWLKIDVVSRRRTEGYGKYFSFWPFHFFLIQPSPRRRLNLFLHFLLPLNYFSRESFASP